MENEADTSGPSESGGRDWLEGRDGLSRESLDRAQADMNGETSSNGLTDRVRAAGGRVRGAVPNPGSLTDRLKRMVPDRPDGAGAEADGFPTAETDGGTSPAESASGEPFALSDGTDDDPGDESDEGDGSEFNWGGSDE